MILTKKIKTKITKRNIKELIDYGYLNIKEGDIIEIEKVQLSKGSSLRIDVKCDNCGREKNIEYIDYIKNIKNDKYYSCSLVCSNDKRKNTCLYKYGVDHSSKTIKYKEKCKETNMKKFGVTSYAKTSECQDKIKKTCLEKYGTEYSLSNLDIQNKSKETCLKKYGTKTFSQTDMFLEKYKKASLEKYGTDNYAKTDECWNKIRKTCLLKYGVEYSSQCQEIKNKLSETCLKRYGFKNYVMTAEFIEKALKSRGLDFETNEYLIFRRKVNNITSKIKKELFENWNGYDYYDNEYIKDNFKLNCMDRNYPSIDHKISVWEGYKNNKTPEELSQLNNLCVTKRSINSSKNNKINWTYSNIKIKSILNQK